MTIRAIPVQMVTPHHTTPFSKLLHQFHSFTCFPTCRSPLQVCESHYLLLNALKNHIGMLKVSGCSYFENTSCKTQSNIPPYTLLDKIAVKILEILCVHTLPATNELCDPENYLTSLLPWFLNLHIWCANTPYINMFQWEIIHKELRVAILASLLFHLKAHPEKH